MAREVQRSVLPIPDQPSFGLVTYDARDPDIGGENNQWYPALYEGLNPVEPPKAPEQGYHLTEDLTDHAIDWVRTQKALMPDKPFFMYFAPGGISKFNGKIDLVQIDLGDDNHDHLIDPEDVVRIAMARQ